jgi:uncharacterized small protein (DUF1192 family)
MAFAGDGLYEKIDALEARIALLEVKNREALAVIEKWDAVYAELNIKDAKKLGKFKADIVGERIALLEAENQRLRDGMQKMSAALGRIDYLMGAPNDMEVSGYHLHCDEREVVANVEKRIALLEAKVQRVYNAGIKGIGFVGAANYASREREAVRWVREAIQEQNT